MSDITVDQLKEKINSGEELNILDVREEWEYEEGHIDGAKNISVSFLQDQLDELDDWKEKEVIIHCKSGRRSLVAQDIMSAHGFDKTLNLLGGYDAFAE